MIIFSQTSSKNRSDYINPIPVKLHFDNRYFNRFQKKNLFILIGLITQQLTLDISFVKSQFTQNSYKSIFNFYKNCLISIFLTNSEAELIIRLTREIQRSQLAIFKEYSKWLIHCFSSLFYNCFECPTDTLPLTKFEIKYRLEILIVNQTLVKF